MTHKDVSVVVSALAWAVAKIWYSLLQVDHVFGKQFHATGAIAAWQLPLVFVGRAIYSSCFAGSEQSASMHGQ